MGRSESSPSGTDNDRRRDDPADNYPAEFGTGTGGQISVITKSGGNKFHGSVFEYFRNDALDAANFFDNIIGKKSKLRINRIPT